MSPRAAKVLERLQPLLESLPHAFVTVVGADQFGWTRRVVFPDDGRVVQREHCRHVTSLNRLPQAANDLELSGGIALSIYMMARRRELGGCCSSRGAAA